MKRQLCAALLALVLILLTGCEMPAVSIQTPDTSAPTHAQTPDPVPAQAADPIPAPAADPAPAPAQEAPPANEPILLSAEEAKAIALTHAGLTADQVTRLWAEFDWDDGVPEFEVEFNCGIWEYDYEIHAETGAILSSEKDD